MFYQMTESYVNLTYKLESVHGVVNKNLSVTVLKHYLHIPTGKYGKIYTVEYKCIR